MLTDRDDYTVLVKFTRSREADLDNTRAQEKFSGLSEDAALLNQFALELHSAYEHPDFAMAGSWEVEETDLVCQVNVARGIALAEGLFAGPAVADMAPAREQGDTPPVDRSGWDAYRAALATFPPTPGVWARYAQLLTDMRAAMARVVPTLIRGPLTPEAYAQLYADCLEVDSLLQTFDPPTDGEGRHLTADEHRRTGW